MVVVPLVFIGGIAFVAWSQSLSVEGEELVCREYLRTKWCVPLERIRSAQVKLNFSLKARAAHAPLHRLEVFVEGRSEPLYAPARLFNEAKLMALVRAINERDWKALQGPG